MTLKLQDKVALVSGSGRGIGQSIALKLASEGARLVINDLDEGPAHETVAAIRAAQLGFKTACIDEAVNAKGGPALGGTCTNVGCIPSKALLQSSEHFEHAGHAFAEHGIEVGGLSLNLGQMLKRKDGVVKANNDGIVYLFKKNKVDAFHGLGTIKGPGIVEVAKEDGTVETIETTSIVIATGSEVSTRLSAVTTSSSCVDSRAKKARVLPYRSGTSRHCAGVGVIVRVWLISRCQGVAQGFRCARCCAVSTGGV